MTMPPPAGTPVIGALDAAQDADLFDSDGWYAFQFDEGMASTVQYAARATSPVIAIGDDSEAEPRAYLSHKAFNRFSLLVIHLRRMS